MVSSLDSAAMGINNGLADRKPDSHSFVAVTGFIGIYTATVKQSRKPFGVNPLSVVFDSDI